MKLTIIKLQVSTIDLPEMFSNTSSFSLSLSSISSPKSKVFTSPSTRPSELRETWYLPPEGRRFDQDLFKTFEVRLNHASIASLGRSSSVSFLIHVPHRRDPARCSRLTSILTRVAGIVARSRAIGADHDVSRNPRDTSCFDLLRCTAIRWRSRRATCGGKLRFYCTILTIIPTVLVVVLHCRRARPRHCPLPSRPSIITRVPVPQTTSRTAGACQHIPHDAYDVPQAAHVRRPTATHLPRKSGKSGPTHLPRSGGTTTGGSSRQCSQPTLCASGVGYQGPVGLRKHGGGAAPGNAGVWIGCKYENVMGMGIAMAMAMGTERDGDAGAVRDVVSLKRQSSEVCVPLFINPPVSHSFLPPLGRALLIQTPRGIGPRRCGAVDVRGAGCRVVCGQYKEVAYVFSSSVSTPACLTRSFLPSSLTPHRTSATPPRELFDSTHPRCQANPNEKEDSVAMEDSLRTIHYICFPLPSHCTFLNPNE
ncbi:hypothetical protein B0H13DRAFT_1876194 [Mycena leptocephala]|nr:hypothetical protein B0H13DRAFT_1876194 [Mycena leptocephala]